MKVEMHSVVLYRLERKKYIKLAKTLDLRNAYIIKDSLCSHITFEIQYGIAETLYIF